MERVEEGLELSLVAQFDQLVRNRWPFKFHIDSSELFPQDSAVQF